MVAAWRGKSRRTIYGGSFCIVYAFGVHVRRLLCPVAAQVLAPGYHAAAQLGVFRWLVLLWKPRLVRFNDTELRLVLGTRVIGRYHPQKGWVIRPPYWLFVVEKIKQKRKAF